MKKIGVLANCEKPKAQEVLSRLSDKAASLSFELISCAPTANYLPNAKNVELGDLAKGIDVLMALGGDGTMLSASRSLAGADIPMLGVNLGSLGFMTSVTEEDLERSLDALANGNYATSTRAVAECVLTSKGSGTHTYRALNDVVVGWGDSARAAILGLTIDGEHVTSYMCDGMMVSTPTGSTGHALSAGGPILHPETQAFVLNVICAHALSARPLVIKDTSTIALEIEEASKKMLFVVDGQKEQPIEEGDKLEVRRSPNSVTFIHLPGYSYFGLLQQKLGWRGTNV